MSQSLTKIYIHAIFSTKHREPCLTSAIQPSLYKYIAAICNSIKCIPIKVGGYTDHIHLLCMLSKTITVVDMIKEVKISSSKWMKLQGECFRKFYWQDGYGAFSINPMQTDDVCRYIENQYEHHRLRSFQEEFRMFLDRYHIPFEEKYLWD